MSILFGDRGEVLPAQAQVQSQIGCHLPVVLAEQCVVAGAQVALGRIRLPGFRVYVYAFENRGTIEEIPQPHA